MTETRYKPDLQKRHEHERAEEILSILNALRVKKADAARAFLEDKRLAASIRTSLLERDSVSFLLPAFPFKSRNTEKKCLGALPDTAEKTAVENLVSLRAKLNAVADTNIIVALDGFAYADVVGVPPDDVTAYASAIKAMDPSSRFIKWFGAGMSEKDGVAMARMLDEQYAPSLDEIRLRIQVDPAAESQYVGLKRFWAYDLDRSDNTMNGKERWRKAADIAIRMMSRNAAYSRYLEEKFPDAIRLSIHAAHGRRGRFHINLLPNTSDTSGGSPWHGVALKTAYGEWKIVKREQAEQAGHFLVYENGLPSHYVERNNGNSEHDA